MLCFARTLSLGIGEKAQPLPIEGFISIALKQAPCRVCFLYLDNDLGGSSPLGNSRSMADQPIAQSLPARFGLHSEAQDFPGQGITFGLLQEISTQHSVALFGDAHEFGELGRAILGFFEAEQPPRNFFGPWSRHKDASRINGYAGHRTRRNQWRFPFVLRPLEKRLTTAAFAGDRCLSRCFRVSKGAIWS